jgi:hypothetical protein
LIPKWEKLNELLALDIEKGVRIYRLKGYGLDMDMFNGSGAEFIGICGIFGRMLKKRRRTKEFLEQNMWRN